MLPNILRNTSNVKCVSGYLETTAQAGIVSDEVMKMVRVACRGDGGCGGFGSGGGGCGSDDVVGGSMVGQTRRSGARKRGEGRWSEGG
ncbi:hypothetical protein Tco_0734851 [Tanacetum coccineum]